MDPRNFAYWLQGALELGVVAPDPDVVVKHANLAIGTHNNQPATPELTFAVELRGAISMGEVDWGRVRNRLSRMFQQVIDPAVNASSVTPAYFLNNVHGEEVARC